MAPLRCDRWANIQAAKAALSITCTEGAMTIAAGIRCTDGIVLCSDTEHTEGDGKYEKPKIFSHDEWLLARSC
jgi:20S proteasome alpha/beta subunit